MPNKWEEGKSVRQKCQVLISEGVLIKGGIRQKYINIKKINTWRIYYDILVQQNKF